MLFSATQTRKIEDLARISLKKEPLYIGVDDQKDKATVEGLEQVGMTSMSSSAEWLFHMQSVRIAVDAMKFKQLCIDASLYIV